MEAHQQSSPMMRRSQSTERQNKRNWGFKLWIDAQKNRKSSFERNNEKISVRIRRHHFHLHSTYTRCKCLSINGAGEGNRTLVSLHLFQIAHSQADTILINVFL